jgi:hypothetical protein
MFFIRYATWVYQQQLTMSIILTSSIRYLIRSMCTDRTNKTSRNGWIVRNINRRVGQRFVCLPWWTRFISLVDYRHSNELSEPLTTLTINRLEEQIQLLKTKVEDINVRLENVTSILKETHSSPVNTQLYICKHMYDRIVFVRIHWRHRTCPISMLDLLLSKMNWQCYVDEHHMYVKWSICLIDERQRWQWFHWYVERWQTYDIIDRAENKANICATGHPYR